MNVRTWCVTSESAMEIKIHSNYVQQFKEYWCNAFEKIKNQSPREIEISNAEPESVGWWAYTVEATLPNDLVTSERVAPAR